MPVCLFQSAFVEVVPGLEMSNETCVLAPFMAAQQQKLGRARAADGHREGSHGPVLSTGARHGGIRKGNKGGFNGISLT